MKGLILKTVGVVSVLVALSSAVAMAGAVANTPVAWFGLCFEAVVMLAAVFGVLTALGRFRDGVAMAIVCVAGAVAVASVLGYIGADRQLVGYSLKPLLLARLLAAAVLGAAAAAEVLRHEPRSLGVLARGVVIGVVPVAVLGAYWSGVGAAQLAALASPVRSLVYFFGFLVVGAMLCAGLHLVIRAFQIASRRQRPAGALSCGKCGYPVSGLPVKDGAVTCSECGWRMTLPKPTAAVPA